VIRKGEWCEGSKRRKKRVVDRRRGKRGKKGKMKLTDPISEGGS